MKFSYDNLRNMERTGDRVGNWKGMPVFASRKMALDAKGTGAYFIVYDDDNVIVKFANGMWCSYGQVSVDGQVMEWDRKRYNLYSEPTVYCHDTQTYEPKTHAVCGKNDAECNGTAAAAATDEVVGDVKIGLDIDALLSSVRTMTVSSLLEGFNYGLDEQE